MNFHSAFTQSTCQKVRHHPVPEVFRRMSGVRILILDVIIYLRYYLLLSCVTCIRFLYDGNKQLQLQEDNLGKDSSFWIFTVFCFMTLTF